MKGISLPVNAIVIIAIAILVLAVVAAFFTGVLGGGIATISLEQAFTKGCDSLSRGYNCDVSAISDEIKILNYPTEGQDASFSQICRAKLYSTDEACAVACGCSGIVLPTTTTTLAKETEPPAPLPPPAPE